MEIPDLLRQRLGDEGIESAVNLGDRDLVCFTPTRTLLYRSEGLISDDSLDVFPHDVERLNVSVGRRKTKFTLEYVDRTDRFSVASDRSEPVLERLLGGIMGESGVLEDDESVTGVFRFSELTVIVTDNRLVKHIGSWVWDDDFEEYPFEDVTGLEFEEGSVATQIVISIGRRPQRIKAPNDEAPIIRERLTEALLRYYDVGTLAELNEKVGVDESESDGGESQTPSAVSGIALDDTIAPLVGGSSDTSDEDPVQEDASPGPTSVDPVVTSGESPSETTTGTGQQHQSSTDAVVEDAETSEEHETTTDTSGQASIDPDEFESLQRQVSDLTTAVQRQNELLTQQYEAIKSLVEELNGE